MKKALILIFIGIVLVMMAVVFTIPTRRSEGEDSGTRKMESNPELVVYAYDSFASEWGPGPQVVELFEENHGITVHIKSVGDAGQVLQRLILEKDDPRADLAIGIDNNLIARAKKEGVLIPYVSSNLSRVPEELIIDGEHHVTPYDYGYFSIIYDTEKISDPPESLKELTAPRFKDSLILMDPRTSSPGLGFLLWTVYQYGDAFPEYWDHLKESTLTITEGWDSGYGLFTNGEAPMVLSYTTSPAYHVEYEESSRYQAAIFTEGHYMQIEGMGVVKGAPNPEAAQLFIDFSLTEEFQSVIPLTNWMYPVVPEVPLPKSYEYAPKPEKSFSFDGETVAENRDQWMDIWSRTVTH